MGKGPEDGIALEKFLIIVIFIAKGDLTSGKEVKNLKICIYSSLLIEALGSAVLSSLDPQMRNLQLSAAIGN